MTNFEAIEGPDRERRLGFAKAVAEHIAPMLAERGFVCTESTPYLVTFESADVVLNIYHEQLSFEMGVYFRRKSDTAHTYYLDTVVNCMRDLADYEPVGIQTSNREGVLKSVKDIAELLQKYGGAALAGDPSAYQRMEEMVREESEAYTKQIVQGPIRKKAEEAWRNRDYARVRKLYEPIEADLTPVEKKKLEYARSHSSSS